MKAKKKIRAQYPKVYCNEMKGRDNKDYYNTRGTICSSGYSTRVPSLKRNKKTWENFYKLFPYIKKALINNEYVYRFGQPTLIGNIYVCKEERVHSVRMDVWCEKNKEIWTGVGRRIRTTKFLKIW